MTITHRTWAPLGALVGFFGLAGACGSGHAASTQGTGGQGAGAGATTGSAGSPTGAGAATGTGTGAGAGSGGGTGTGGGNGQTLWKPLRIGAGGFLTGLDVAADGTKVVRTDTYGAYLWDATQWKQLVTATSMPAADVGVGHNAGTYEIRIAPSNTSRLYMAYANLVYRSDDKGGHWTATTLSGVTFDANGDSRVNGEKMAVDPANPDVVYFETPTSGVWLTTDGGTTWSQVDAIPVGGGQANAGLAFDATSGTAGGKTKTLYVPNTGHGVYRSTDAGATWVLLPGGPSQVEHAVVSAAGVYYCADGTAAWKYAAGAWTNMNADRGWHTIVSDPASPTHLIVGDPGGTMNESLDGGATWLGDYYATFPAPGITRVATDIPWLAWTNETYLSNGAMALDPLSHLLFFAEGIGMWTTSFPSTYTGFDWTSQSLGIEQLVANVVVAPPGGQPVVASWDRALFHVADPDVFPAQHGVSNAHAIVAGWDVDYATSDPTFLAAVVDWFGVEQSAYSTDSGKTWTPFAAYPTDPTTIIGGSLAVGTPTNIVVAPSNNALPYVTSDGGKTWSPITLPGASAGTSSNYYLNRHIVAADRVTAGTFYLYHSNAGLFRSTDGGTTWALQQAGEVAFNSGYNAKLRSVPGKAGHLFFTSGSQSTATPTGAFMHSTDGGATWNAIPGALEVLAFGFGKEATPGGYPTLFVAGWIGGVYGIWRSGDEGQTWTSIGTFPLGSLDAITTVEGDKNVYGTVYVGFSGSGYAYGTVQ